jgi:hypothetical protein
MKIKTWDDVDGALARIAELAGEIAEAKARADDAKAEIADIEPRIEDFTREHEADLLERSRAVDHGRVWLRKATALKTVGRTSWKRICDALVEDKRWTLIRKKYEVDKEALGELSDERLAELRVKRETSDTFGYEAA